METGALADGAPEPAEDAWEGDVVTADGGTVHIRRVHPTDADRITAFHGRQSPESIYFRYFSARPALSEREVQELVNADGHSRAVFVALVGEELVGIARYDRYRHRDEAEVAFFVDDEHKGRGVGTILLEYLVAAGRDAGLTTFTANVLPSNRRMLGMFHQAGFESVSTFADGVVELRFAIEPTATSDAAVAEREATAEARSVARLLTPDSVAVIGAGRNEGMGHEILRRLLEHRFNGPVYPVNRDALHVAGVRAYPSVVDVPDRVDLAIVAVPAAEVLSVVHDCARAHVGALVVVTAGFGETGPDGHDAERELVAEARRNGMRLLGPNSLGLISTAPTVRLHATFSRVEPIEGRVALSAQSGALAASIVQRASEVGLGLSAVVSVGNKADVSGNDLLRYWQTDARTDVVLLYLESFGNPRRFGRIAREVSRMKPIVAVKPSHDSRTDALVDQAGIIRVDTLERMLDVGRVLAGQAVPAGDRVAVIGNSGGPALLAAESCKAYGLVVAHVGAETASLMLDALPAGSRADGPIDLTHAAGPLDYEAGLRGALADEAVDAALVLYAPGLIDETEGVARAIGSVAAGAPSKPVVASFPGAAAPSGLTIDSTRWVPTFAFPDAAAFALGRAAAYSRWRSELAGPASEPPRFDAAAASAIVTGTFETRPEGARLAPGDTHALLLAAGASMIDLRFVAGAEAAVEAAEEIGFPVALKATGLEHLPKTEAGGIALDLQDAGEVERAFHRLAAARPAAMEVAVVQRMTEPGTDVRVRVASDDVVGAAAALGPGGAAGEALADETVRLVPLTDAAAAAMVDDASSCTGLNAADRAALTELIERVAWLVDGVPEVAEIVCNPVIVGGGVAAVADASARVAPWRRDQLHVRRL